MAEKKAKSQPKMRTCKCTCFSADPKKTILAIVAFLVIAQIVHSVGAMATMGYYMDPAYTQVWSSIMMPTAGAPPATFFFYSIGFGLITAIFFVLVYTMMGFTLPGKTLTNRGLLYGLLIFLVGGLSGLLMTYLILNVPVGLVAEWAVESLVINLINGVLVAKIMG